MELPGNHCLLHVGPVMIGGMDPDARDLMDLALTCYQKGIRLAGERPSVPGFVKWLFKESGLVDDVEAQARPGWRKHMASIRESLKNHPNPKFRRAHNRGSIYGFAYWFFRWSGLVDPKGKAVQAHEILER